MSRLDRCVVLCRSAVAPIFRWRAERQINALFVVAGCESVWVFGSTARNGLPGRDLDLYVLPQRSESERQMLEAGVEAVLGIGVDVIGPDQAEAHSDCQFVGNVEADRVLWWTDGRFMRSYPIGPMC